MAKHSWDRQREALGRLTRVLVEERRGGLLGDALDHLLDATGLSAGAAYVVTQMAGAVELERVAERNLSKSEAAHPADDDRVRAALEAVAKAAAERRRTSSIPDLSAHEAFDANAALALAALGLRSVVAAPIVHQRQALGVIVLLAAHPEAFDPSATSALQIGTHIVALAAERDRRAERELAHRAELSEAARMASLGLVIATVAHELRTPLEALLVQLEEQQMLIGRFSSAVDAEPPIREMTELLGEMRTATAQIGTFLAQLASVSRRDAEAQRLDLRDIAQEALSLIELELRRRSIRLIEQYTPPCLTQGDRSGLLQVVTNLVFYAADACSSSGRTDPTITLRVWPEESRVILAVEDTGPGIADSDIPHIFQPLAPQKRKSSYAGLALKICSHVVSAHHGHIEVLNTETGASLRVILPRVLEPERVSPTSPISPATEKAMAAADAARQVFVVDDDDLFCRTMRRALKPHDVRSVLTASEAEIALLDPAYDPHLVICDLGLPGFGGDVLHARIKTSRPDLARRFVFVTGGACSKAEADYVRASGCATLLKPVETRHLLDALRGTAAPSVAPDEAVPTLRSDLPEREPRSGVPTVPPKGRSEEQA